MRWSPTPLLLIFLTSTALFGDEGSRRAQMSAAATDAANTLRREILDFRLSNAVTVEQFLDRLSARNRLDALLQTAQQIGGTRWLDAQTCQIRLEIDGDSVANLLESLALKHPGRLPVSFQVLHQRMRTDVIHRTFAATGASTAGSAASRLRPDASLVAWRAVNDKDRQAAIEAARRAAMDRVVDSLRQIDWDGDRHLADALAVPAVQKSVLGWLADRPVTSIEFRDDLEVRICLAASPEDFWPALQADLQKHAAVAPQDGAKEWEQLHQQVIARMAPAVGRAVAPAADVAVGAVQTVIPREPPAWTLGTPVTATGESGSVGGSKLRTARAAEAVAMDGIRLRLNSFPLDPTMTLGQAASKDPHIQEAIARSLRQARISRVEYDTPRLGSVRVQMQLDPQAVWREIAGR
jgi:hypothetical protein